MRVTDLQPHPRLEPRRALGYRLTLAVVASWIALASTGPGVAQEFEDEVSAEREVGTGQLREAMRTYFENRLRRELALSDEQMAEIEPRIRELEQARSDWRMQKVETVRRLNRGIEGGASDVELQQGLDRLEQIDDEQRNFERGVLRAIDDSLTVRQRVQLRFFLQRFKRDMAERVRELREDGGPGRGAMGRRRPPGAP